jgi:tRNA(Ile2) C34 agmatinyltransferase TiaS
MVSYCIKCKKVVKHKNVAGGHRCNKCGKVYNFEQTMEQPRRPIKLQTNEVHNAKYSSDNN